ncbi:MAG TPA: circumsporozoite protein [Sphingomicrobium sp.]|nr:circumsporozoite protein [Sphingomicrobium sp.]
MKRLAFVIGGAAALALAGCSGSNQDAVNNAVINQPSADDLNALANQAAMDAANNEAAALANQQQTTDENASADENVVNQQEADEQNVSAM